MTPDDKDPFCICCNRPRSAHNKKMQCPETSYFTANVVPDQPKVVPATVIQALSLAREYVSDVAEGVAIVEHDAGARHAAEEDLERIDAVLANLKADAV